MSYRVWSKAKGPKPVVMSFAGIKEAIAKGDLSLNDEYEEHYGRLGSLPGGKRMRLGDVHVFRDARADAERERLSALAEKNRTVQAIIDARRRNLQTAPTPQPEAEKPLLSGMLVSWRASLISFFLSLAACPFLVSGSKLLNIVGVFVGLLIATYWLRPLQVATPPLFITPVVFGLLGFWGFDAALGAWFHGAMTMAICLAGSLLVDEFAPEYALSVWDRLIIFLKYAYVLTFSIWLGFAGFDGLPTFLTMTAPYGGRGGEQAILLSLVAIPLIALSCFAALGALILALSWVKNGPSK